MNITLSAPSETIRTVREWAESEHSSLNQYIRDCLEAKANALLQERARAAEGFASFLQSVHVTMPKGWRFNREEANER